VKLARDAAPLFFLTREEFFGQAFEVLAMPPEWFPSTGRFRSRCPRNSEGSHQVDLVLFELPLTGHVQREETDPSALGCDQKTGQQEVFRPFSPLYRARKGGKVGSGLSTTSPSSRCFLSS